MSIEKFDEECRGCRPAMIDGETGRPLPHDNPEMKLVLNLWATKTTPELRRAWHAVTCLNSREPENLRLAASFATLVQEALVDREVN